MVRVITKREKPVYGLSFPQELGILCEGTYFTFEKKGSNILLTSGTKIEYTQEEINKYEFEDCK